MEGSISTNGPTEQTRKVLAPVGSENIATTLKVNVSEVGVGVGEASRRRGAGARLALLYILYCK